MSETAMTEYSCSYLHFRVYLKLTMEHGAAFSRYQDVFGLEYSLQAVLLSAG
jgi:hypothetical protein